MLPGKDYASMTFDQLVAEEKKLKSQKIPYAVFIGLLVGITIWSAAHKGGSSTFMLLTFALLIFKKPKRYSDGNKPQRYSSLNSTAVPHHRSMTKI